MEHLDALYLVSSLEPVSEKTEVTETEGNIIRENNKGIYSNAVSAQAMLWERARKLPRHQGLQEDGTKWGTGF